MDKTIFRVRAEIAKAMAHPTRLMLVEALRDGEKCVCELAEEVEETQPTVSKHLAVLRATGIVEDRKEGLMVLYRLRCPCILDFFKCIERVLREDLKLRRRAVGDGR